MNTTKREASVLMKIGAPTPYTRYRLKAWLCVYLGLCTDSMPGAKEVQVVAIGPWGGKPTLDTEALTCTSALRIAAVGKGFLSGWRVWVYNVQVTSTVTGRHRKPDAPNLVLRADY